MKQYENVPGLVLGLEHVYYTHHVVLWDTWLQCWFNSPNAPGLAKSALPSVILTKHVSEQHFGLLDQLQPYHTTRPTSASMASSMDLAATGGGTKMALASADMGCQSCALYVGSQGVEPLT